MLFLTPQHTRTQGHSATQRQKSVYYNLQGCIDIKIVETQRQNSPMEKWPKNKNIENFLDLI